MIAFSDFTEGYNSRKEDLKRLIKESGIIKELDSLPGFFGTWNSKDALDGLFGLFVVRSNGDEKFGVILDGLGIATFEGIITPEQVTFLKSYQKEAIARGAAKGPLAYEGEKRENFYYGTFSGADENGHFFMWPDEAFPLLEGHFNKVFSWFLKKSQE